MQVKKSKVLLCWGYNRKSWIEYFEKIKHEVDFTYLFFYSRKDEDACYTDVEIRYYWDFKSAKEILRLLRPEKVIFMGLEGWHCIALNIECKRASIPTFYMVHGSSVISLDDHKETINFAIAKKIAPQKLVNYCRVTIFLVKALGIEGLKYFPALLKLQYLKNKISVEWALKKVQIPIRKPDYYIVYTEKDKQLFVEQDLATEKQFWLIGTPDVERFIDIINEIDVQEKGYLLYLESPLSDIPGYDYQLNLLPFNEHLKLIEKFNEYALLKGLRLKIKLHPYSYQDDRFPKHENIDYYRDCEKEKLILQAHQVIFYTTSLATPALMFKDCIMFTVNNLNFFQKGIWECNVCPVISHTDILSGKMSELVDGFIKKHESLIEFQKKYIGFKKNDPLPTEKLARLLNTPFEKAT